MGAELGSALVRRLDGAIRRLSLDLANNLLISR